MSGTRTQRSELRPAGTALLLCLVLLAALTLLGLAAASDRDLQIRVTANSEHSNAARGAAERGLRWAEDWLFSRPGDSPVPACRDACAPGEPLLASSLLPPNTEQRPLEWWATQGHGIGTEPVSGTILRSPESEWRIFWIIAEIDTDIVGPGAEPADTRYYRVLGMAADMPGREVAVAESIVARPWNDPTWTDALPMAPTAQSFCRTEALTPCGRLAWRQLR